MAKQQTEATLTRLESELAKVKTTAAVNELVARASAKLTSLDKRRAVALGTARVGAIEAKRPTPGPTPPATGEPEKQPTPTPKAVEPPPEPEPDDTPKLIPVKLEFYRELVIPTPEQRKAGRIVTHNDEAEQLYNEWFGIRTTENKYTHGQPERLETPEAMIAAGYREPEAK